MLFGIVGLLACTGETPEDSAGTCDAVAPEGVTAYDVEFGTSPGEAVAGEEAEFTLRVLDQRGCPIEDLQQNHERMVHTLFISKDLASFQHIHHEDFATLTADDLRSATYHFPVTFPTAGDYRLVFDFAHNNQYLTQDDWMTVGGAPAMGVTPVVDMNSDYTVDGMTVSLTWDVAPFAGYEAAWTVHIVDESGADVTDIVQWLGADAHVAVATEDLGFVSHTHAWFPDMENTAPGHPMPHFYDGPDLPFHFAFPTAGTYKMWVQFARADAPESPHVAVFGFEVAP